MYPFLDHFFAVFHGAFALFNVSGWAWKRTRRLHLATSGLTLLSWFGLGIVYGWGYCPCTDWHWQVKRALGEKNLPASYVKYYVDRMTGLNSSSFVVDNAVLVIGVIAFGLSCWLNWKDHRTGQMASDSRASRSAESS